MYKSPLLHEVGANTLSFVLSFYDDEDDEEARAIIHYELPANW